MLAKDVMTTTVITARPETPVREIAQLLLSRHISAVPVVSDEGRVLGIVSEGDLMRRAETGTTRRCPWWLALFAGTAELADEYAKSHGRLASDVMTREVVSVTEDTSVSVIAALLEERRIKRVSVIRDGRLVGIVSRADLLRGLVVLPAAAPGATVADDRAIREQLLRTLQAERWTSPGLINIVVTGGVVHLWGLVQSEPERAALRVAATNAPGVRQVEDHLAQLPDQAFAE